jgi:hypothetical protein
LQFEQYCVSVLSVAVQPSASSLDEDVPSEEDKPPELEFPLEDIPVPELLLGSLPPPSSEEQERVNAKASTRLAANIGAKNLLPLLVS